MKEADETPAIAQKKKRRRTRAQDLPKARERFLHWLRLGWSVTAARQFAGLAKETVYKHRERDPAFAAAWEAALEEGTDRLEDEAVRRAVHGVKDPIVYEGKIVGARLKYSDVLLITLLNARRPEKFKYRAEVTEKPAEPIDLSKLSDKQLDALEDIRRTLRGEKPATGEREGEDGQHDRTADGDPVAPPSVH